MTRYFTGNIDELRFSNGVLAVKGQTKSRKLLAVMPPSAAG